MAADTSLALKKYDSARYGPLFAVSDEGSAAQSVIDAAYESAKAHIIGGGDVTSLGVILDGERMTSAGEVPIGPVEYATLTASVAGRLLLTTNVGVRVNTRLLQPLPEFAIPAQGAPTDEWYESIYKTF